jgi:hypothetical protein
MTAEPTSLGIGIIVTGAMALVLWFLRRLKRRAQKEKRLVLAR